MTSIKWFIINPVMGHGTAFYFIFSVDLCAKLYTQLPPDRKQIRSKPTKQVMGRDNRYSMPGKNYSSRRQEQPSWCVTAGVVSESMTRFVDDEPGEANLNAQKKKIAGLDYTSLLSQEWAWEIGLNPSWRKVQIPCWKTMEYLFRNNISGLRVSYVYSGVTRGGFCRSSIWRKSKVGSSNFLPTYTKDFHSTVQYIA